MMTLPRLPYLLLYATVAAAARSVDTQRVGSIEATIPLTVKGGRVLVTAGLGTPAQKVNLVLSPDEGYVTVVGHCASCVFGAPTYDVVASTTANASEDTFSQSFTLPGEADLTLSGVIISDTLNAGGQDLEPAKIHKAYSVVEAAGDWATRLPDGISGFWGLLPGDEDNLVPPTGFTVGLDLAGGTGEMHWGGVMSGAYLGRFNWISTRSWAVDVDGFLARNETRSTAVAVDKIRSVLDPGVEKIYVPTRIAEDLLRAVGGTRDREYTDRWNMDCSSTSSVSVRVGGITYRLDPSVLAAPRDKWGRTCWANIVAWDRDEIRLGTAFLSGVYLALHSSPGGTYLGLAGKPGSVNAKNMHPLPGPNRLAMAITLSLLLPALIIGLGICYLCNAYSWKGRFQRQAYDQARMTEAQAQMAEAQVHVQAQHAQAHVQAHVQAERAQADMYQRDNISRWAAHANANVTPVLAGPHHRVAPNVRHVGPQQYQGEYITPSVADGISETPLDDHYPGDHLWPQNNPNANVQWNPGMNHGQRMYRQNNGQQQGSSSDHIPMSPEGAGPEEHIRLGAPNMDRRTAEEFLKAARRTVARSAAREHKERVDLERAMELQTRQRATRGRRVDVEMSVVGMTVQVDGERVQGRGKGKRREKKRERQRKEEEEEGEEEVAKSRNTSSASSTESRG